MIESSNDYGATIGDIIRTETRITELDEKVTKGGKLVAEALTILTELIKDVAKLSKSDVVPLILNVSARLEELEDKVNRMIIQHNKGKEYKWPKPTDPINNWDNEGGAIVNENKIRNQRSRAKRTGRS